MKPFELYHIAEEDLYLSIDHKARIYCQPTEDLDGYIPLYARLQIDDLYTYPIIYPGGLKLAQFFSKVSFGVAIIFAGYSGLPGTLRLTGGTPTSINEVHNAQQGNAGRKDITNGLRPFGHPMVTSRYSPLQVPWSFL